MNRRVVVAVGALTLLGAALAAGTMRRALPSWREVDSVRFGFGRHAGRAEIAALDIDVRADGTGLPAGRGTAKEGAAIYAKKCSACHGPTGVEGPYDPLVSTGPTNPKQPRTVGNYWGFATTLFDFVHRAMPQTQPGSLTPHEMYAVVGWILWRNQLIAEDAIMDRASLPRVMMPARARYYDDPRPANLIPRE